MIPYLAVVSIIMAISVAGKSASICSRKFSKPPGGMNMSRRAGVDAALRKVVTRTKIVSPDAEGTPFTAVKHLEIALERGESLVFVCGG